MNINDTLEIVKDVFGLAKSDDKEKLFKILYYADDEQIYNDLWKCTSIGIIKNNSFYATERDTTDDEFQWLHETLIERGLDAINDLDRTNPRLLIEIDCPPLDKNHETLKEVATEGEISYLLENNLIEEQHITNLPDEYKFEKETHYFLFPDGLIVILNPQVEPQAGWNGEFADWTELTGEK